MRDPCHNINVRKLEENLDTLSGAAHGAGCSLAIVSKVFCADPDIVNMLLRRPDIEFLADSRVRNLATYADAARKAGKRTLLLRLPQASEISEAVRFADVCFVSEAATARLLDAEAEKQGRRPGLVLMIDLGDLREGLFYKDDAAILAAVREMLAMKHARFAGLGTNLTCYGAVIPKPENLSILSDWAARVEKELGAVCEIVSGGNSSSYYLVDPAVDSGRHSERLPAGINNLRLGESFVLGNDTAWSSRIPGTHDDAVTLEAQVIEAQTKPSLPIGETGVDAFGNHPVVEDRGLMRRALLAIGRQDTDPDGLYPLDPRLSVIGASSDHLILNCGERLEEGGAFVDLKPGDVVPFKLGYGALLKAFTSSYVSRRLS
jgi:predicted amino acid racemase